METLTSTLKTCARCGRDLPFTEFRSDKRRADGLYTICKTCQSGGGILTAKTNPALEKFTPRELIEELRARGYKGELQYTKIIKL